VPGVYLDTSALGRLLLGEADAPLIRTALLPYEQRFASRLLRIELVRLALRSSLEHRTGRLLAGVSLVPLDEATMRATEAQRPSNLGTLDAIHLATALSVARRGLVEAIMTFDRQLAAGAREYGLEVLAPGS
jgi:predicted nucleic acid-binding protein